MKKIVSLSLLLLANIIILAHSIIPHHHHNEGFVCIASHCVDSDEHHNHENEDCHSHEHENNTSDCCLIKDILHQIIGNKQINIQQINENFVLSDFYQHEYQNASITPSKLSLFPFRQKPHLLSFHSVFLIHSLGLRAPPTFS